MRQKEDARQSETLLGEAFFTAESLGQRRGQNANVNILTINSHMTSLVDGRPTASSGRNIFSRHRENVKEAIKGHSAIILADAIFQNFVHNFMEGVLICLKGLGGLASVVDGFASYGDVCY